MKTEFKLSITPCWSEMERVFDAASRFFGTGVCPDDVSDLLTMIACELVENGIKYGEFGGRQRVCLHVSITGNQVDILVQNPVGASSQPYLRELDRTIQWVHGFQDPYEAYIARMRRISGEPIENNKSGLGIVRVTYEGRANLDFFINEDNILHVSAVTVMRPRKGPA